MIQTIRVQCACRSAWDLQAPLSEVALELGYYDQSHFTNDYRRFVSNTPSGLFAQMMSDFSNT